MSKNTFKRGKVYWTTLPDPKEGSHVQGGARPCVIISNNTAIKHSEIIKVLPLSGAIDDFPSHVDVNLHRPGQVLCEQILTVDKSMLGTYVGTLSSESMAEITKNLAWELGIML